MTTTRKLLLGTVLATACIVASAQNIQTNGSLVVVPATGELTVPNDQARVTLQVEEQDKERDQAASRVNQKMKQGIEMLKRQDASAVLKSYGYYTYAVYADPQPVPAGQARQPAKARPIVGWRVGQYLEMTTENLTALPKTVASVQSLFNLNGLQFGLSPAANKKLDAALFDATYKNLEQRIGYIAGSMHRTPADAMLETLDFEGSGNYVGGGERPMPKSAMMMRSDMAAEPPSVAEPSFEPGESTVSMRLVAKVRFNR